MNKRTYFLLSFIVFAEFIGCIGCAGSPLAITLKSAKELKQVPARQLCAAYAWGRSKTVKREIERRGLFDEREWRAIGQRDVFVGMSKNAMLAARANLYITGVSRVGRYGLVEIYKEMATIVDAYIYVRDDKVIGFQMW